MTGSLADGEWLPLPGFPKLWFLHCFEVPGSVLIHHCHSEKLQWTRQIGPVPPAGMPAQS